MHALEQPSSSTVFPSSHSSVSMSRHPSPQEVEGQRFPPIWMSVHTGLQEYPKRNSVPSHSSLFSQRKESPQVAGWHAGQSSAVTVFPSSQSSSSPLPGTPSFPSASLNPSPQDSGVQFALHPSPDVVFPSSQTSPDCVIPSPQTSFRHEALHPSFDRGMQAPLPIPSQTEGSLSKQSVPSSHCDPLSHSSGSWFAVIPSPQIWSLQSAVHVFHVWRVKRPAPTPSRGLQALPSSHT